jgi:hypothetical protein
MPRIGTYIVPIATGKLNIAVGPLQSLMQPGYVLDLCVASRKTHTAFREMIDRSDSMSAAYILP